MRLAYSAALCVALTGCGGLPLGLLGGGGPNVAANTQLGAENRQAGLSFESGNAGRDVVSKEVEAGEIDNLTITNENVPPWVFLLALLGWLLPTPTQMGNALGRAMLVPFRREK